MSLDPFVTTARALPAMLWIIAGVGLPWALVVLPRRDWRDRALVACVSLAFGPALLTAWMFALGTLGMNDDPAAARTDNPMQTFIGAHTGGSDLLTPGRILAGTLVCALAGLLLAWRKARRTARLTQPDRTPRSPLAFDEGLLVLLIALAAALRWFTTSALTFGSWDELWVYGYQGRIYTLTGYIPADVGYYPQFLPLQYAFMQRLYGGIDDHAARAVVPFLQVGSILATYALGAKLFGRRAGIFAAALWALYPHFGYWTRIGDLEIPLAFGFTGAAAFFLAAWTENEIFYRRRYALIAGLFLGIALWTKPTAGAFILGVILAAALEGARLLMMMWRAGGGSGARTAFFQAWRAFLPRLEVAVITGLACLPLGGLWYARNLLIGHKAVVFPPAFWQTQAERSGAEFGWPLLALAVLLAYIYLGPLRQHPRPVWIAAGVGLVAAGVAPSIFDPHRMGPLEWLALAGGAGLLAWELGRFARARLSASGRGDLAKVGWVLALALPYFVTWFYAYSYHYRLSFAIVPLLLLPAAVILARWFTAERVQAWRPARKAFYRTAIVAASLWGVFIFLYDEAAGWDWLRDLQDPFHGQSALERTVTLLEGYVSARDEPPVILAPGNQRLPFYFPTLDIRVAQTPRTFEDVADVTLFIDGSDAIFAYGQTGEAAPYQNQLLTGIVRENAAVLLGRYADPTFFYETYELRLEQRFVEPDVVLVPEQEIVAGGFARLVGYNVNHNELDIGDVWLRLVWQVIDRPPADYTLYMHLIDPQTGALLAAWDGPVAQNGRGYYSTLFWQPGEYVVERRALPLPATDLPAGDDYILRIGFYNGDGRVPVTADGQAIGDGYTINVPFIIGSRR